jgi:hypothetical protein
MGRVSFFNNNRQYCQGENIMLKLDEFEIMPSGYEEEPDYADFIKKAKAELKSSPLFETDSQPKVLEAYDDAEISLGEFYRHATSGDFEADLPGYLFVGFAWLLLDSIDLAEVKKLNVKDGARIKDDKNRAQVLAEDIQYRGFKTALGCPQIELHSGMPMTGRGRIRAFKEMNGETYCPVSVYVEIPTDGFSEEQMKKHETDKMVAVNQGNNLGDPQTNTDYDSFVLQIKIEIEGGRCNSDVQAKEYLRRVCAHKTLTTAQIGQIYNSAVRIIEKEESAMYFTEAQDSINWVKEKCGWVEGEDYHLVNFKDLTYMKRLWCDRILTLTSEETPLKVIGYTSNFKYSDAKQNAAAANNCLKTNWKNTVELVSAQLSAKTSGAIEITKELDPPYEFLGFIPQSVDHHDIEGKLITDVENY